MCIKDHNNDFSSETPTREVNPDNLSLAQRGVSGLLDSPDWTSVLPSVDDVKWSSGKHSLLLLPLIEDYLDIYLDTMHDTTRGSSSSSASSQQGAGEVVVESVSVYLSAVERQTVCALSVLDKLIDYCSLVRLALASDNNTHEQQDVMVNILE